MKLYLYLRFNIATVNNMLPEAQILFIGHGKRNVNFVVWCFRISCLVRPSITAFLDKESSKLSTLYLVSYANLKLALPCDDLKSIAASSCLLRSQLVINLFSYS